MTRALRLAGPPAWGILAGAAFVAYLALAPGSSASVTAVNDVVQALVPLAVAAPLAALTARSAAGRGRVAWALLAAGAACWGLGQVVWTWFEVVRDQPVPFPGLADVCFVGSALFLLAGVLVFPSTSLRSLGRARAVVDGCIAVTATLFASYGTFLGVVYRAGEGDFLARALGVAYPSADLLILAVVLAVMFRRAQLLEGALPWIGLGVALLAVADGAFAYLTATGEYGRNLVTDAGWPLGFGCLGFAAWSAMRAPRGGAQELATHAATTRRTVLAVALPYLPVIPAGVVFAVRATTDQHFGPFLGVTGSALVLLFLVRQIVTLLENRDLTNHLEETVAALQHREAELHFQAFHDPLTALANRALFRDRLDHALSHRDPEPIAVLFVDLDDFKVVNDTLGHDAGDRLLVRVAERLRACVRPSDTAARLGGDEFAILLEGARAEAEALHLAERVLGALDVPFTLDGHELDVTASVGLAGGRYGSAEEVLKEADIAMYAAKAGGKARVESFRPSLRRSDPPSLAMVGDDESTEAWPGAPREEQEPGGPSVER